MSEEMWKNDTSFGYNVNAPMQHRFTQEEIRTFRECEAESFVQRSLPFGTMFGLASYFGVQKGYLSPNARFGALPKVSLAVVFGYFLGKLSYQGQCAEKLMALPDSYIGQLLRERRDGMRKQQHKFPSKTELGVTEEDIYSDAGPGNSLDLDTTRPSFGDDTYQPDSGSGSTSPPVDGTSTRKTSLTYEDLRNRNRGLHSGRVPSEQQQKFPPKTELGISEHGVYSDAGRGHSLHLDTSRPYFDDDTSFRPDIGPISPSVDETRKQSTLTYEELRNRNRGENFRRDAYEVPPNDMPVVRRPVTKPPSPKTNKYGDDME